jgi:putative redox protein
MSVTERTVQASWTGGLRAVVRAGDFEVVTDEPASAGGTGTGPQPTELLLASVASCFTLALAFSARKLGIDLDPDTRVEVTGRYEGPQFSSIRIAVHTGAPAGEDLGTLIKSAERVCYVTRTLRGSPDIEVVPG